MFNAQEKESVMYGKIDALLAQRKNALQIAEALEGVIVEGGFYPIGIQINQTVYYHPGL